VRKQSGVARLTIAIYVCADLMTTSPTTDDEQAPAPQPDVTKKSAQHEGQPTHPGVPLAPPGIVPESDVRVSTPSSAAPMPEHGLVEGLGELPSNYGDGRLVALVRDPATLWVYWDFSPQQIEQAFHGLGQARALLKVWNTRGAGAELVRDEEVHLEVRGWYVRNLTPGTELRVELWAVGERGARMLRSGRPVRLPPGQPSDQLEAFYLHVPLDESLHDVRASGRPLQYGGSTPAEWDRRIQPRAAELPTSPAHGFAAGSPGPGPNVPSSPHSRLPWSMTHVPDLGEDK
jgi:hypothetical protein